MIRFSPHLVQQAQHELLLRHKLRRSLCAWARAVGYDPAHHHVVLLRALQRVARGSVQKLMVMMPPGSAKSTYASVLFPAWVLARIPSNTHVLTVSHSSDLAEHFSKRVRSLVSEHGVRLGYRLSERNRAVNRWETEFGAGYLAAGVGTGISGYRCSLILIDDPIRSREEAESLRARDKLWEWYQDELCTRLVPGGKQMLIMTRWHNDDLAGRLLEAQGEQWTVISIPAQAEENDPLGRAEGCYLWDGAYGYANALKEIHKTTDHRTWSALYQQRPTPREGGFFTPNCLLEVATFPPLEELRTYGASDYAVTAQAGDYTVHLILGMDQEQRLYLLDVWRKQTSSDVWIDAWCQLVHQWRPIVWIEEKGQIIASLGPFIEKRMQECGVWTRRISYASRGDKVVRAQAIRGFLAHHPLHILKDAPWKQAWLTEFLTFPSSAHDDQVDALALFGRCLKTLLPPRKQANELRRNPAPHWRLA